MFRTAQSADRRYGGVWVQQVSEDEVGFVNRRREHLSRHVARVDVACHEPVPIRVGYERPERCGLQQRQIGLAEEHVGRADAEILDAGAAGVTEDPRGSVDVAVPGSP